MTKSPTLTENKKQSDSKNTPPKLFLHNDGG